MFGFSLQIESSLCYLLTVRVIRARNIHQADVCKYLQCSTEELIGGPSPLHGQVASPAPRLGAF